uniref:Retrovirus-related Pol polyprotein from transposon TNT 1-94 n=1 Tax=Tanacetum cinerariifolium TaxID=118510 RepID=A0A6L2KR90_TANCI|nr:retrovirus-related Pol polyprotein from transposon TNT 1-94 [Tanacetum cinerariifolium]
MIPKPGDTSREVPVNETFHVQTYDELTEKELKQIEVDDQAIQTILLGLPEDVYAAVDSCETAQEIWFTSNDGESIESYYHCFLKLMNDLKRNKHFPGKIASNLKFLNNLQPEWSRHVTIVHQTKDLHTVDYTQLYDFLKYNQKEVDELKAERLAKTQDPLALMANSNNPYAFPAPHQDQPSFNQNYIQQPIPNLEDITDPTTAMNMALALMAKAFKLNYSTLTNNNQRISSNLRNKQIAQLGNSYQNRNGNLVAARAEGNATGHNDRSAEVHNYENCYDNEIFNMFTQEKKYPELLEPIPEPHQVPHNDNNVISEDSSEEQSGGTVEKHPANVEETRFLYDSLYNNLAIEVEKVNTVNRKLKETNAELTTKLARFKNQENRFEISQEKYDKLESCYQKFVYQEQCLSKKINALHLSFEEILQLAQESRQKMKQLNKEIKPANYTKINHLSGVFVSQTAKSHEELYFLNISKTANVSTSISIPNEEFSNDTTPNVARKFLNEEAAKFVGDFKSLAKEADKSLAKYKALELEIERLLRAVISQDIMSVVQKAFVVDTSNLQTELERTKGRFENCIIKKEMNMLNFGMIDTLNPLSQKLENENVELEFQVLNYAKENVHLKIIYKNLFDSISVLRTQTKTIIAFLQNELQNTIYENAKLRAQLFKMVSVQKDNKRVTSNSIPTPQESKVMQNDKVIAPGMFSIDPFKTSREEKHVPNNVRASVRTKPITVSQPPVFTKKDVNSDTNGLSSTRIDNTKTRRPQPRSNTKNDRVLSASTSSCNKNKGVEVEEHHRNLLLSKNKKHMSSACNNIKLDSQNVISKVVCAMCKQCLISVNHDVCLRNYVNGKTSRGFSKHMTRNLKLLINFVWKFMGTVRFGNDHVVAILGFDDLQWGNVLITMVYFVKGLGHNLFSVGQFCDSDLDVAFRRNAYFVRNLKGVDLLKGDRSTNLYTINLHDMASASPICLMAHASSTKSWLWHQHLSYHNFDTINDLAKNDLVSGLPKCKYHKEHLCPSCVQGKSKRASHPPKPVLNSRQRLHLLHIDLYGPMRIASINRKRYVLVIVDDYSSYTWVHFLRLKDEAPEAIKTFLKRISILLQSPVIIIEPTTAQNSKIKYLKNTLIVLASLTKSIATACFTQNRSIIHRRFNKTPYELINGKKPDISFLYVFEALCYPKNDREDIGELGAKGDIGFFIGYSADSCAYRVYNRRTKKIIETMNVLFDELSAMAFEQRSSKPALQSMTSGQISSGLDLTYAPSTITTQQPTEGELDLLFEAMYDDFIGGQPSAA